MMVQGVDATPKQAPGFAGHTNQLPRATLAPTWQSPVKWAVAIFKLQATAIVLSWIDNEFGKVSKIL